MKNLRKDSGFFRPGLSNFSSIQTLFGDFINDRTSPSLLKNYHDEKAKILTEKKWDNGAPYERVIETNEDLKEILQNPKIIKNSICIIEPADHVGKNLIGEDVRASSNIASLCQFISDCDSILIPLWKTGKLDNKLLIDLLQNSLAVFVEGGHPTVKDSNSFKDLNISLDELQELTEELILSRGLKTAPSIFICLGHQLAAQAHIRLIKKAVNQIVNLMKPEVVCSKCHYENLLNTCKEIINTGENLSIYKDDDTQDDIPEIEVAKGWDDPCFAVALNEVPEVGQVELLHYSHNGIHQSKDFPKLLLHHELTSEQNVGIVEQSVTFEKNLNIVMFHSDEVNEEAILFANWAYGKLHNAIAPIRKNISVSEFSWLLSLPDSIEIVCSTSAQGKLCTQVSATCINYTDYETQHKRRSFTFQFHPELLEDLREFNKSGMPSYEKLKNDDGIRMLIRVIYESITD